MHSQYHYKFVKNAFLNSPYSSKNSLFDEYGMIPYDGDASLSDDDNQEFSQAEDQLDSGDIFSLENVIKMTRFDIKNNNISMVLVKDLLLKKCSKKPYHQEIKFLIKNTLARISVNAVVYAGTLNCIVISSDDELRRRLSMVQRETELEICRALNMYVEIRVSDEILLGRL